MPEEFANNQSTSLEYVLMPGSNSAEVIDLEDYEENTEVVSFIYFTYNELFQFESGKIQYTFYILLLLSILLQGGSVHRPYAEVTQRLACSI